MPVVKGCPDIIHFIYLNGRNKKCYSLGNGIVSLCMIAVARPTWHLWNKRQCLSFFSKVSCSYVSTEGQTLVLHFASRTVQPVSPLAHKNDWGWHVFAHQKIFACHHLTLRTHSLHTIPVSFLSQGSGTHPWDRLLRCKAELDWSRVKRGDPGLYGEGSHLVHCSKGSGAQDLDSLQLCLLQDAELCLVGCCATWGQGLHKL